VVEMRVSALQVGIFVIALFLAISHAFYVQFISYSLSIGGYFLVSTILFAAGGFAALTSGKLFKPAVIGLFVLSLIDNLLILVTATTPTPLSGGQAFGFSTDWMPPGNVQVFVAQVVLMVLTGYVLLAKRKAA
jgi:hypothetical protein